MSIITSRVNTKSMSITRSLGVQLVVVCVLTGVCVCASECKCECWYVSPAMEVDREPKQEQVRGNEKVKQQQCDEKPNKFYLIRNPSNNQRQLNQFVWFIFRFYFLPFILAQENRFETESVSVCFQRILSSMSAVTAPMLRPKATKMIL